MNNYDLIMSKLTKKHADKKFGDFGDYIYFSPQIYNDEPWIKFYGGTKETSFVNAPCIYYDIDGNTRLEISEIANEVNCPNAFNEVYVAKIETFIKHILPILLLVWYEKLDESDALHYFKGRMSLKDTINCCFDIRPSILTKMHNAETLEELHSVCREYEVYKSKSDKCE